MSATIIQFPSQKIIISYLKQHPFTKDLCQTEMKIVEAVAAYFANQKQASLGIKIGILLSMYKIVISRDLSSEDAGAISLKLHRALSDEGMRLFTLLPLPSSI